MPGLFFDLFLSDENRYRFEERKNKYSRLNGLVCERFEDILLSDSPCDSWCWLSFFMATFRDDNLFENLDMLIECASHIPNFDKEFSAKQWKKYEHLYSNLWELQCLEFLLSRGLMGEYGMKRKGGVKGGSPDYIYNIDGRRVKVEFSMYHKEFMYRDILEKICSVVSENIKIHDDLWLKRDSRGEIYKEAIAKVVGLSLSNIDFYKIRSRFGPVEIYKNNFLNVRFECGNYFPSGSEYGDPRDSMRIYIKEMIGGKIKKNSNGIGIDDDVIFMFNGLFDDCQRSFGELSQKELEELIGEYSRENDVAIGPNWAFLISCCGIDSKIVDANAVCTSNFQKILGS